ncbi:MAG: transcriptional regulator, PadR family [Herbinix sp.]|nr:transcriptional regulator, PadR family [Herbinix sp.]
MKKTRYVILGLLNEEELSGYDIKKVIGIRMSFFWQESYGQIYPELNRMKEEGLIEQVVTDNPTRAKIEKIRYRITDQGKAEFKQWMEALNEKDHIRSEFLLKMYFATEENSQEMKKHLEEFKKEAEQKVMLFGMFEQELLRIADTHGNHRQILKVIDLGLRQAKLYVEWSTSMLDDYQ